MEGRGSLVEAWEALRSFYGPGERSLRRLEYKSTRSMQFVSKFMKNDLLYLKTKICMKHMARLGQAIKTNLNVLAFFCEWVA